MLKQCKHDKLIWPELGIEPVIPAFQPYINPSNPQFCPKCNLWFFCHGANVVLKLDSSTLFTGITVVDFSCRFLWRSSYF